MSTPKAVLSALDKRDGHVSAWTGAEYSPGPDDVLVPQHRQDGMGGSPFKHRLSNVVWLESSINGLITSDAKWQAEADRRGISVSRFSNPAHEPMDHAVHGRCLLDDDGGVHTGEVVF